MQGHWKCKGIVVANFLKRRNDITVTKFGTVREFQTVRDWIKVLDPSGWGADFVRVLDNGVEYFAWDLSEATENFQAVLDREVKDTFRSVMDEDDYGNPVWSGWKLEI